MSGQTRCHGCFNMVRFCTCRDEDTSLVITDSGDIVTRREANRIAGISDLRDASDLGGSTDIHQLIRYVEELGRTDVDGR